jgi:MFS family permease
MLRPDFRSRLGAPSIVSGCVSVAPEHPTVSEDMAATSAIDRGPGRFASLKVRNYRLYFFGQLLSQPGTYIQTIGQSWLVLHLTNSGTDLGLVLAAQYLPVLFFGAMGGVFADRYDNRKIMLGTQSTAGALAILLGVLVLTGSVRIWMVMALATCFGFVMVADSPARQSFASEMVGPDQVANAVALSLILNNVARVIGPSIGAGLIAFAGIGYCFVANGISYFGVVIALAVMDQSKFFRRARAPRGKGEVRAGLRHVRSRPVLRDTLIMLAVTGMTASGVSIMMPLLAKRTFHGNATTFAFMTTSMGIGAVLGGVLVARSLKPSMRTMAVLRALFALCIVMSALVPVLALEYVAFAFMGLTSTMFTINANSALQLWSDPQMRGRVMSLWAVALLGTQPIAAPIFGYVAQHAGPRPSLLLVAAICIVTSTVGFTSRAKDPTIVGAPVVETLEPFIIDGGDQVVLAE